MQDDRPQANPGTFVPITFAGPPTTSDESRPRQSRPAPTRLRPRRVCQRASHTPTPHVRAHTVHARTVQHIGCDSLESARALAAHAEALSGVDAIAGMAPSFFRPTSAAALVDFLAPVAAAAPGTPFFYYHFPTITNCTVNASEFFKVAKETGRIPTLAGMKYTVRNHDEGTHRPS